MPGLVGVEDLLALVRAPDHEHGEGGDGGDDAMLGHVDVDRVRFVHDDLNP